MTTDEHGTRLESHLDDLRATEADLRGELPQASLGHWEDPIDDTVRPVSPRANL